MVTGIVIAGRPVLRVMVRTPPPAILKVIVLGPGPVALEVRIACLSEPAPLSFVFVTMKAACGLSAVALVSTSGRLLPSLSNTRLFVASRVSLIGKVATGVASSGNTVGSSIDNGGNLANDLLSIFDGASFP